MEKVKQFAIKIPGVAQRYERQQVNKATGTLYTPKTYKAAKEAFRLALLTGRVVPMSPWGHECSVQIVINEKLPSRGKRKDIDNYAKLVLDAMNDLIYVDDVQVVQLMVAINREADEASTELTVWSFE